MDSIGAINSYQPDYPSGEVSEPEPVEEAATTDETDSVELSPEAEEGGETEDVDAVAEAGETEEAGATEDASESEDAGETGDASETGETGATEDAGAEEKPDEAGQPAETEDAKPDPNQFASELARNYAAPEPQTTPATGAVDPTSDSKPAAETPEQVKERFDKQMHELADKLAAKSPSAAEALRHFRANGGQFVDGKDSGYFKSRGDDGRPTIGILTEGRNGPTSEADRMATIAHELGHHDFDRRNGGMVPPGDPKGPSDAAIEARREADFIRQNNEKAFRDEQAANALNAKIRDEYLKGTGQRIPVPGVDNGPFKGLGKTEDWLKDYAQKQPSGSPPGTTYRDYYTRGHQDIYNRFHAPGAPGR